MIVGWSRDHSSRCQARFEKGEDDSMRRAMIASERALAVFGARVLTLGGPLSGASRPERTQNQE